ncbi:4'-phosphopantetheinyl transferase superfamily protein [bacterium]|nr:4'-phosphopantetheinyl transferase superfamily protein [bacterium]
MYQQTNVIKFHKFEYSFDEIDFEYFLERGIILPNHSDNWAKKRKRDYLAGRYCAMKCLQDFGFPLNSGFQILSNKDRSVLWPEGYCGSITHTSQYVASVVARCKDFRSLGIDSENKMKRRTFDRIKRQIAKDNEIEMVQQKLGDEQLALTLIFSAKESIYKSVFPISKVFFYFEAFCIDTIDADHLEGYFTKDLNPEFTKDSRMSIFYEIHQDRVDTLVKII